MCASHQKTLSYYLSTQFALKEDDALNLWKLAGYDQDRTGMSSLDSDDQSKATRATILTAGDVRILYTDMVHVKSNKHGLVINFLQSLGQMITIWQLQE